MLDKEPPVHPTMSQCVNMEDYYKRKAEFFEHKFKVANDLVNLVTMRFYVGDTSHKVNTVHIHKEEWFEDEAKDWRNEAQ